MSRELLKETMLLIGRIYESKDRPKLSEWSDCYRKIEEFLQKPLPEPVGEITRLGNYGVIGGPFIGVKWASGAIPSVGTKLYAEPSEINPMPDVEISKAFCDETGVSIGDTIEDAFEAGVRFAEEKHGIKEQE